MHIYRSMKFLIIPSILIFAIPLYGNDSAPIDNLAVLNRLTGEITHQAIDSAHFDVNATILIRTVGEDLTQGWYIENQILQQLLEMGCDTVLIYRNEVPERREADIVFEFSIRHLGVEYKGEGSFWKTKSVIRNIVAELWMQIYDGKNGRVLWSGALRREFTDRIKPDQLKSLENPYLSFTSAPAPPPVHFKKIVEPTFIIGVTGTIVYLFYSLRSK